jgi:branched-chain amino acid transport system permease protein
MTNSLDSTAKTAPAVDGRGIGPARRRSLVPAARYLVPLVLGIAAILLADALGRSIANQGTELLLLALLALSWNVIGGYGGLFSLGHQVFVGVGGYALIVILSYTDLPLPVVLIAAALLSAVTGVVLGYPMLRLRGPYFAIGTLGVALAVLAWMLNWPFTKASQSYPLPMSDSLGFTELFQLTIVIAVLALLAITALVSSPLGLRLVALRDDESGAASLGVRRVRTLLPVWAVSGFLAGLVGALFALQQGSLTPASAFSIQFVLDAIVVCVIGGVGTLYGPLLGAVVVFALRQYTADFGEWAMLIEALVVILVVRLAPEGLWGILSRMIRAVRRGRPAGIAPQKEGRS